jgi:hypothetical protein
VEHRLALGRIEAGEELLVRGDGHASMLAAPRSGRTHHVRSGHGVVPGTAVRFAA